MAYNPPIGSIYHLYTTYILPSGGLYATYHLLGEPGTTIDLRGIYGLRMAMYKQAWWICCLRCARFVDFAYFLVPGVPSIRPCIPIYPWLRSL